MKEIEQVLGATASAGDPSSSAVVQAPSAVTPDEVVHTVQGELVQDNVGQPGQIPPAAELVSPPRILISYRREETASLAAYLADRLGDRFGSEQVVKDVRPVNPSADFAEVIELAVASCDVVLVLIGDRWLTVTDVNRKRRLDNPKDVVRMEIEAALQQRVRILPILVEDGRMPGPADLPDSLVELARRQALELSSNRLPYDISRLIKVLDRTLGEFHRGSHYLLR